MKIKRKPQLEVGDIKIITKFAFLPIKTTDYYYWLQCVKCKCIIDEYRYRKRDGTLAYEKYWLIQEVIEEK